MFQEVNNRCASEQHSWYEDSLLQFGCLKFPDHICLWPLCDWFLEKCKSFSPEYALFLVLGRNWSSTNIGVVLSEQSISPTLCATWALTIWQCNWFNINKIDCLSRRKCSLRLQGMFLELQRLTGQLTHVFLSWNWFGFEKQRQEISQRVNLSWFSLWFGCNS